MRYWKLYRQGVYTSILYFIFYTIFIQIFWVIFNPTTSTTMFLEKYFSSFFTAIYLVFTLLNVPINPNNFLNEISFCLLLPIKKRDIVITRYLKDFSLLLLFQLFILLEYAIIVQIKPSFNSADFFKYFLIYFFIGAAVIIALEPIYIAFRKIPHKTSTTKLMVLCFYLGVPFATAFPIFAVLNNSRLEHIIFSSLKTFLPILLGYISILTCISFVISYMLLLKSDI
ncbi:ABC-2 transporter permease [Anaerocellum danielii]|uniref:ABC-2 transporter permease n=1 Tax=Anaerocellum danielii TaxID=1387557 RepID=A0ABZ0U2I4_9FIRM|nr:ABC-2 transporter permease [Caldicellulosiruptor danielii]WPX08943.1 ABC-2 transporter permease [Caldicellulosiruptor danielii]